MSWNYMAFPLGKPDLQNSSENFTLQCSDTTVLTIYLSTSAIINTPRRRGQDGGFYGTRHM